MRLLTFGDSWSYGIGAGYQDSWTLEDYHKQKSDKDIRPKVDPIKPTLKHLIRGHQIDKSNFPDMEWNKYIFQS